MKLFVDAGTYMYQLSLGINICKEKFSEFNKEDKFRLKEYKEFYITVNLFKFYFSIGIRTKPKIKK